MTEIPLVLGSNVPNSILLPSEDLELDDYHTKALDYVAALSPWDLQDAEYTSRCARLLRQRADGDYHVGVVLPYRLADAESFMLWAQEENFMPIVIPASNQRQEFIYRMNSLSNFEPLSWYHTPQNYTPNSIRNVPGRWTYSKEGLSG